jgi:hypothetical protein
MEGTLDEVVELVPIGGNPVDGVTSVKLVLIGGNPVDEDVDGLMEGTLDVDADDVGDVLIGRNFSLVPSC